MLQIFVAPIVVAYTSYDATPWADAVSGGFLLVAALVVWPAAVPEPDRSGLRFDAIPALTDERVSSGPG